MESSQKMREGISVTENPENAVNPGKNGRQNLSFCQMLCSVRFCDAFYSIQVTHQLTLSAHCGSCILDIDTIQVCLVYYCHKGIVKSFASLLCALVSIIFFLSCSASYESFSFFSIFQILKTYESFPKQFSCLIRAHALPSPQQN